MTLKEKWQEKIFKDRKIFQQEMLAQSKEYIMMHIAEINFKNKLYIFLMQDDSLSDRSKEVFLKFKNILNSVYKEYCNNTGLTFPNWDIFRKAVLFTYNKRTEAEENKIRRKLGEETK